MKDYQIDELLRRIARIESENRRIKEILDSLVSGIGQANEILEIWKERWLN